MFQKYKHLLYYLVYREIRVRYQNTILGYFWTLLEPIGLMLIYTIVFSIILRFNVENYSLFLLSGLIPWMFLTNSINKAARSLTGNAALIKKVYFPREIFPLTVVLSNLFNFGISLTLVFLYSLFLDTSIQWLNFIYLPFIILLQTLFIYGVSLFVSVLNVFYRDVEFIINIIIRGWMYLTPIIYPLSMVPEKYLNLYLLNPMAVIISLYHAMFYGSELPSLYNITLSVLTVCIVLFISYKVFGKLNRRVGEVI